MRKKLSLLLILGCILMISSIKAAGTEIQKNLKVAYQEGQPITLKDGSKYHVFQDTMQGTDYIYLVSDYNIKSDGTQDNGCHGICSPMKFDSLSNDYDKTYLLDFINNTYLKKLGTSLEQAGGDKKGLSAELPEVYELIKLLGNPSASHDSKNQYYYENLKNMKSADWLLTTNYWTKTQMNEGETKVYYLDSNGKINYDDPTNDSTYGIRPIIRTLTTNIKETTPATIELKKEEDQFFATVKDENGIIVDANVLWMVDEKAATCGVTIKNGVITNNGNYNEPITVTAKIDESNLSATILEIPNQTTSIIYPLLIIGSIFIIGSLYYFYQKRKFKKTTL